MNSAQALAPRLRSGGGDPARAHAFPWRTPLDVFPTALVCHESAAARGTSVAERLAFRDHCGACTPRSARNSHPRADFDVSVCDSFDARFSAVLRDRDESDRLVQKSAESTSMWPSWRILKLTGRFPRRLRSEKSRRALLGRRAAGLRGYPGGLATAFDQLAPAAHRRAVNAAFRDDSLRWRAGPLARALDEEHASDPAWAGYLGAALAALLALPEPLQDVVVREAAVLACVGAARCLRRARGLGSLAAFAAVLLGSLGALALGFFALERWRRRGDDPELAADGEHDQTYEQYLAAVIIARQAREATLQTAERRFLRFKRKGAPAPAPAPAVEPAPRAEPVVAVEPPRAARPSPLRIRSFDRAWAPPPSEAEICEILDLSPHPDESYAAHRSVDRGARALDFALPPDDGGPAATGAIFDPGA